MEAPEPTETEAMPLYDGRDFRQSLHQKEISLALAGGRALS
jgi:hypothetical protein